MIPTRLTRVRRNGTRQSHCFITEGRGKTATEDQSHRSDSTREKIQERSSTFDGCPTTRTRRRYLSTCIFSLGRLNDLDTQSDSFRVLSRSGGPVNGSAHSQRDQ